MWETIKAQIDSNVLECLALNLINCNSKNHKYQINIMFKGQFDSVCAEGYIILSTIVEKVVSMKEMMFVFSD